MTEEMDGLNWPYTCQTCGVECENLDELADPDHHNWPANPNDAYAEGR